MCKEIKYRTIPCVMPLWFNTYVDGELFEKHSDIKIVDVDLCYDCAKRIADIMNEKN